MPVNMSIRNVPDEVRDVLAARAAAAGQSLQEYVLGQLAALASKPTDDELWERIRARVQRSGVTISAEEILAHRDADRP
ncbi:hypothetical protein [Klenkia sp. PcliD-1-E]|uniref:FitA-like ribbon-helix-helix domain-containing protein n=1 Tax=Klenkia sp. PcliD-1-E TaxID=2954492 RepID=UPI002097D0D3|nr:hypothetical protein [Klenkia sp. PcliD-1-E]MCO7222252.1 hypothetical protein [Klenkia sp. PcliD-1-E]